jgi:hypothetical protein
VSVSTTDAPTGGGSSTSASAGSGKGSLLDVSA